MSDDGFLSRWSRRKQLAKRGEPLPDESPPAASAATVVPSASAATPVAEGRAAIVPLAEGGDASGPQAEGRSGDAPPAEPPPTLADVAALTRDSDFSRFVKPGVDEDVKRAAMKKLFFSDPHFNTMDGLDVYIDDYSKPDPIPAAMLRKLVQSQALGLFDDEKTPAATDAANDKLSPPAQGETALPAAGPRADNAPDAAVPDAAARDPATPSAAEPAPDEDADLRLQQDDAARRDGGEPPRAGAAEDPAGRR